jgi:ATP-dependent DNA helicase RecG
MEENDVFKLIIRYEKENLSKIITKGGSNIKHADKILEIIAENPKITAIEIGKMLILSENHVRKIMAHLVNSNMIERKGSDKSGKWILLK